MEYYNTYYFANIVQHIVENRFAYLRTLEGFFLEPEGFAEAFPKTNLLHQFIDFCVHLMFDEDTESLDDLKRRRESELPVEKRLERSGDLITFEAVKAERTSKLWIDQAIRLYKIDDKDLDDWLHLHKKTLEVATDDDLDRYYEDLLLTGTLNELSSKIADEVFFVMFLNRDFLRKFHEIIAQYIHELYKEEGNSAYRALRKDGVLKRIPPPTWARNAVSYRDRERCVICDRDLSGRIGTKSRKQFDHIVPLDLGGANDVTNIQLLCGDCNNEKKNKNTLTSKYYERWY